MDVKERRCSKCGKVKHIADFNKSHRHKDGLNGICKECRSVINHEVYMRRVYKAPERRKCSNCGIDFTPSGKGRGAMRYCSPECVYKGTREGTKRRNRSKRREKYGRIASKLHTMILSDKYIRDLLRDQFGLSNDDITGEMIELKREQVQMRRYLKQSKEVRHESDNSDVQRVE